MSCPPPAWAVLERALRHKRPVVVRYHSRDRLVCPHALGWKAGRPKVLVYQSSGATSQGQLPDDPRQRWRSLFVDEIAQATISLGVWATADNFSSASTNCIDELHLAIDV